MPSLELNRAKMKLIFLPDSTVDHHTISLTCGWKMMNKTMKNAFGWTSFCQHAHGNWRNWQLICINLMISFVFVQPAYAPLTDKFNGGHLCLLFSKKKKPYISTHNSCIFSWDISFLFLIYLFLFYFFKIKNKNKYASKKQ